MPETTNRELPVPPGVGVLPDVPYWIGLLAERLDDILGPESTFQAMTLEAGMVGGGHASRINGIFTELSGAITKSTALAHGDKIATLAAGHASATGNRDIAVACTGQSSSAAGVLRLRITTDGGVYVFNPPTGATRVELFGTRFER